jgi:hypothetical protein
LTSDYVVRKLRAIDLCYGFVLKDELGKPIVQHDLDERAEKLVKFAQGQKFDAQRNGK